jgi:hypothetical protein
MADGKQVRSKGGRPFRSSPAERLTRLWRGTILLKSAVVLLSTLIPHLSRVLLLPFLLGRVWACMNFLSPLPKRV